MAAPTPRLGLPRWVGTDPFRRADLDGAMVTLDDAVLPRTGATAVAELERALVRVDTRRQELTYTSGNLTRVDELAGTTLVRRIDLTYDANGNLTRTVEAAGGRTITTDLTYDATTGNLTGTARTVA